SAGPCPTLDLSAVWWPPATALAPTPDRLAARRAERPPAPWPPGSRRLPFAPPHQSTARPYATLSSRAAPRRGHHGPAVCSAQLCGRPLWRPLTAPQPAATCHARRAGVRAGYETRRACVTQKYYPSLRDFVGSEFACRVSGQLLTI